MLDLPLQVLPLVPGKVHAIHQSQRLHHVRHEEHQLLRLRQRCFQSADEKHDASGGAQQYRGFFALDGQAGHYGRSGNSLLLRFQW